MNYLLILYLYSVILRASSVETAMGSDNNNQSIQKEYSPGIGWSQEGTSPNEYSTNMLKDDNTDSSNDKSKYVRYPSLGSPNNKTSTYYFNIGTVDSFERKLEEAQRNLGNF